MPRYSDERRTAVLKRLLPPHNESVAEVSRTEGMCEPTLYNWLKRAREEGLPVPGSRSKSPDDWSGEAKLAVVLETASMNAEELSAYCRSKGLYPEQIARWKQACIAGASNAEADEKASRLKMARANKKIRNLEKELRRKEKALAESAALLVLQKKFNALLEDEDE